MKLLSLSELQKRFPEVYEFIKLHDMVNIPEQRYELENDAYVNVESYSTYKFEDRRYESHIKYMDIQCIIYGRENIVVEPIKNLLLIEEYNPERDIAFYKNDVKGRDCYMEPGDMLLLEPEDGHMPCISIDDPVRVKKAVFKIPIR